MQVVFLPMASFYFALVTLISEETCGNVVIFRGENDRVTNMLHGSDRYECHILKAHCFDGSCTYCQCAVGETFIQTRGQYGECVSNDLIIYATCKWPFKYVYATNFKKIYAIILRHIILRIRLTKTHST